MKKIVLNSILLLSLLSFISCSVEKITIHKINGSPSYENSKLNLVETNKVENGYSFTYQVDDYQLGIQTPKEFDHKLANSAKGQHIHFIVNNGPYFAQYSNDFEKEIAEGSVVLAFLSRSFHESVKNSQAYVLTQIGDSQDVDLSSEFLFYSRPKGKYSGEDTKKLLLDFYLVNTQISSDGNKVRVTIINHETFQTLDQFTIDEWAPYYIEGLPLGKINIKLELIDSNGDLIDTPFNPSNRTIILE
tara:strand:+ start:458 stop:1195 length:738 start_codon:yes stop_codon:yes gene_type:complete